MKKFMVVMMLVAVTATGLFANASMTDERRISREEVPTCHIVIKGSYDSKPIDVNVTIQADNCAKAAGQLLKEAMKK